MLIQLASLSSSLSVHLDKHNIHNDINSTTVETDCAKPPRPDASNKTETQVLDGQTMCLHFPNWILWGGPHKAKISSCHSSQCPTNFQRDNCFFWNSLKFENTHRNYQSDPSSKFLSDQIVYGGQSSANRHLTSWWDHPDWYPTPRIALFVRPFVTKKQVHQRWRYITVTLGI